MRILQVHETHQLKGGSEIYVRDVIDELKHRNIECDWLAPTKGLIFLIKTMISILQDNRDTILDIVSDGDLKSEISSLISAENMSSRIFLHGSKSSSAVSAMMSDSHLLTMPSVYPESFGIVGIEAFAHSKPVVAFDVGGVSSWPKDGFNGYLVENKNTAQFRKRVDTLLKDASIHKEFAKNAYASYLSNFKPQYHLDRLIQV